MAGGKRGSDRMEALVRGILIGGSIGALAALTGIMDMHRAIFLGGLCGILAVITRAGRRK